MSDLHQAVEDYITVRRALGSKLERHPRLLENFAAYLEAAGARTVTTELALAWAWLPGRDAHPTYVSNRLCAVRGFARHLQAFDPATGRAPFPRWGARCDPLTPPPRTGGYGSDRSREEVSFGSMPGDAAPQGSDASPGRDAGATSPVGDALDVVAACLHTSVGCFGEPVLLRQSVERAVGL